MDELEPVTTGEAPRQRERREEETRYQSVIVHRNAEARRHPDDILEHAIEEGQAQCERSTPSLALSALAAGLIVGFSAMAVGVITSMSHQGLLPIPERLAQAFVYPLGFVVCVISGTELFTEHTATALYPALDRKAPFRAVLRVWSVVLLGNLIGAVASATLLALAEPVVQASEGYGIIAHHLTDPSTSALFMSAVLAGWLMAMGGWLVLATPPGIAQIASIYLVTFLIGLGGLHHSIAGTVEAMVALLATDAIELGQVGAFVAVAAAGNLLGGSFFVAVLNYGHIRPTQFDASDEG